MTDAEQELAERAKFEAWVKRVSSRSTERDTVGERPFYGDYYDGAVNLAWLAWKEAKGIE